MYYILNYLYANAGTLLAVETCLIPVFFLWSRERASKKSITHGWDGSIAVHFFGALPGEHHFYYGGRYSLLMDADIEYFILPGAFPGKAPYVECCFERMGKGKDTIACRFEESISDRHPGMEVALADGVNVFGHELQGWVFQISITGHNYQTEKFTFDFCLTEQEVLN